MPPPRVRFAPAPSGWLHVGGARTALYNWLYARGRSGAFVLRVEDTDAERTSEDALDAILQGLRFLNLDWDEGPQVGGPHGPYRQSERRPLYASVAEALLAAGHAYDAYETPEELEAQRRAAQEAGLPPGYQGAHRQLTDAQREAFMAEGRKPVLRLRTPDEGATVVDDAVRGRVEFDWADVSDFVIQRADGSPTYFLANTVDDLAMGISLVARGDDLLSATPRQQLLMDLLLRDDLLDNALAASRYPARPPGAAAPTYAHLPLLVGPDRKPLSKRHGSVAVDEYRRQGFLPEVLVNFLALCGWSYDATTERFTADELVAKFSFQRVGRNPAYFDTDKLRSMNGDRIRELSDEELAERLQPYFNEAGLVADLPSPDHQRLLLGFAPLLRERIQNLAEAVPLVAFAFGDDLVHDDRAVGKHLVGTARDVLAATEAALGGLDQWTAEAITAALDGIAEALGLSRRRAFQPVRVAVTGSDVSPPLPETLALLEPDLVLTRLRAARALVGN
ncbi:MAG TPA: glutamate--tRNA ligase [Egibacteraceae bacterium]|nr:glutamate--tRNA ligase [Actinomycetota bacterium]HWB71816.1 glutamate--tRNA ligase [Egibacteraceae bacterium]